MHIHKVSIHILPADHQHIYYQQWKSTPLPTTDTHTHIYTRYHSIFILIYIYFTLCRRSIDARRFGKNQNNIVLHIDILVQRCMKRFFFFFLHTMHCFYYLMFSILLRFIYSLDSDTHMLLLGFFFSSYVVAIRLFFFQCFYVFFSFHFQFFSKSASNFIWMV